MAVQNSTPAPIEIDLEATAELPALDFETTVDTASSTDVHVSPAIPAGVAELASSLRDAEQRLARKMERVVGLEGELNNALRTAVELRVQLDQENTQKTRRENVLRETEQQLARNAERVVGLEGELATAQRASTDLRAQLERETTQGVRRDTALRDLEQKVALGTERALALEGELAVAQRMAAELRTQLEQETTQGTRRETALQGKVEALDQLLAGLRQELVVRDAARQRQSDDMADLRRCNERLVEALQTWQGFRGVAVAQLDEQDGHLSQVSAQHAGQLVEFEARIAALQAESGAARLAAQQREATLQETLRAAVSARVEQDASLQANQQLNAKLQAKLDEQSAQQLQSGSQHTLQLAEIEARIAALQAESGAARLAAQQREAALEESLRAAVAAREEQVASVQESQQLMAKLQAKLDEQAALQAELGAARLAAQQRAATLEESLRAAVAAREESLRVAVAAREEQVASVQESLQLNATLQAQLAESLAASARVEQDLRVAEEHIHRLEAESHANAALLGGLQQNIERLARDDTGSRPMLRVVPTESTEPVERVLIRSEGGVEVVYQLGKRTTVGRTPDNDIQVDTSFISRHHAVLLSSPDQCLVEDLNSTNGIQVNGKPVVRHALRDGDLLSIGKTEFRFQQRS